MGKRHAAFSILLALAAALAIASASAVHHKGPAFLYPLAETPGAVNPDVTQANIQQTICTPGYTATIRPTAAYTTALKKKQIAAGYYQNADTSPGDYEEDHFISLELGGNPTDPKNLWPQPYNIADANDAIAGARQKDRVENFLHTEVCSGALTLKQAQDAITGDWYAVYIGGQAYAYKTSSTDD